MRKFLLFLKWQEGEINDSILHLRNKGWFVVKNPFEDANLSKASLTFRIREYLKYLKVKLLKSRVYIDDPLKQPPVFNNMKSHVKRVIPTETKNNFYEPWMPLFLIRSLIRNIIIITLTITIVYVVKKYGQTWIELAINLLFPE